MNNDVAVVNRKSQLIPPNDADSSTYFDSILLKISNDKNRKFTATEVDPLNLKIMSNFNDYDFDDSLDTLYRKSSDMGSGDDDIIKSPEQKAVEDDGHRDSIEIQKSGEHGQEDLKKAGYLAGIFLDSKKAFLNDNNILDPNMTDVEKRNYNNPGSVKSLSRSTLVRAERVKTSIGLKYVTIERIYEGEKYGQYPGVDGVYNPLQIIRNRKIRSKYHEHAKPLSVKTIPLASNVFSIKNMARDGKRQWKLLWSVELNELISDQSWRISHIHELKKPNGELWYPESNKNSKQDNDRKQRFNLSTQDALKRRLHDRLFNEDSDSSSYVSQEGSTKTRMLPLNEIKLGRRDRFKQRVKKSLRYSTASSSSSFDESFNHSSPRIDITNDMDTSKIENSEVEDENLNRLSIKPIDSQRIADTLDIISPVIDNEPFETPPLPAKEEDKEVKVERDIIEDQLMEISHQLNLLNASTDVKYNFLSKIYPRLETLTMEKLNYLLNEKIPDLNRLMININDDVIPANEMHCTTLLNEVKSLMQIINDDYSIRIDNLLTTTDRLSGEISTSMSLELRKVDEQLDKLNDSLFGNVVTDAIRSNKDKILMKADSDHRILYLILENFIVVMLRLVWVIVNIYNFILWIIKFFLKILKFILF